MGWSSPSINQKLLTKTKMTTKKNWRCTSSWKWWLSIAMLVFGGVEFFHQQQESPIDRARQNGTSRNSKMNRGTPANCGSKIRLWKDTTVRRGWCHLLFIYISIGVPCRITNISHLGKLKKSSTQKCRRGEWDMLLVPTEVDQPGLRGSWWWFSRSLVISVSTSPHR